MWKSNENVCPFFFIIREELGDALLRCDLKEVEAAGLNGDSNSHDTCGAVADDEEDDDEDDDDNLPSNHGMGDEPHSLQVCDKWMWRFLFVYILKYIPISRKCFTWVCTKMESSVEKKNLLCIT